MATSRNHARPRRLDVEDEDSLTPRRARRGPPTRPIRSTGGSDEEQRPFGTDRPMDPDPDHVPNPDRAEDVEAEVDQEPAWSTYRDATKGPSPVPDWVITDPRAVDDDLGVMKTGKEAEVSLLRRTLERTAGAGAESRVTSLMAVKRYRAAEHRNFHRNAGYLEGRRVKKSREMRAIETRTAFGREIIASQWAVAEFAVLSRLWSIGAAVPYPVQLHGSELMMQFIGSADGVAAPRLAQLRPDPGEARDLYLQLVEVLGVLAEEGYAHGDLSAYNVLVHDGQVVIIDLPQAVDLVGNPQGFTYLRRDCDNICSWFDARGVTADASDLFDGLRRRAVGGE